MYVPWHICGDHKNDAFLWVQGIELRLPDFHSKHQLSCFDPVHFVVLWIEHRASDTLGKHCLTKLLSPALFYFVF